MKDGFVDLIAERSLDEIEGGHGGRDLVTSSFRRAIRSTMRTMGDEARASGSAQTENPGATGKPFLTLRLHRFWRDHPRDGVDDLVLPRLVHMGGNGREKPNNRGRDRSETPRWR